MNSWHTEASQSILMSPGSGINCLPKRSSVSKFGKIICPCSPCLGFVALNCFICIYTFDDAWQKHNLNGLLCHAQSNQTSGQTIFCVLSSKQISFDSFTSKPYFKYTWFWFSKEHATWDWSDLFTLEMLCFHILGVFYNKTMTGRSPLKSNYRGKNVKTAAIRRRGKQWLGLQHSLN